MVKVNTSNTTRFSKITSFIGLSTPKSRLIIFGSILLTLFLMPYSYLVSLPKISLFQNLGIKTYSFGETRALSLILHGQFREAWEMNKLAYAVLGVIIILLAKDITYLSAKKNNSLDS